MMKTKIDEMGSFYVNALYGQIFRENERKRETKCHAS